MPKEEILVECPSCGQKKKEFATDVDRIVKCHNCHNFITVPGKVRKRMELQCPYCEISWNISIKLRGKIYKCWQCERETQLPAPAELNIEQVALVEEVEQGGTDYEMIIIVSNPGTPAVITGIQMLFGQNEEDMSENFNVKISPDNPSELGYGEPIQLRCFLDVGAQAPMGLNDIYIRVEAEDLLDGSTLGVEASVQWMIIPQRTFIIATEHDLKEVVGVPFALQLWTYLGNGEVDTSYQGSHFIQFRTTATQSTFNHLPQIPPRLRIDFQGGVGTTESEFILYNSNESPKIIAWEEGLGGPEGESDLIALQAGELSGFDVLISSPQVEQSQFQGENYIRAVDEFGNLVTSFRSDVWIYPVSNQGEVKIVNCLPNTVPGSLFENGMADLTRHRLLYTLETLQFSRSESFLVSYQEKEGCSQEIIIEENPIKVEAEKSRAPEVVEQGEEYECELVLRNLSPQIYNPVIIDVEAHFRQDGQLIDDQYEFTWLNQHEMDPQTVSAKIAIADSAIVGSIEIEVIVYVQDRVKGIYAKGKGYFVWYVEPKGRVFQILNSLKNLKAGEPFSLELGAFFQNDLDENYTGEHLLHFESNATASPNDTEPYIPEELVVIFQRGIGQTDEVFCLMNATESSNIQVFDSGPGGPKSHNIPLEVIPAELGDFWISLQSSLINGEYFGDSNMAMALDVYGNLKTDFQENCYISPESQRGAIYIGNSVSNEIPAESFEGGIVNFSDLELSYRSDIKEKLPKQEKFYVECSGKRGMSKEIEILPGSAKIKIARCSTPEEIDIGGEFPIYLELENIGDRPANISSVLFSFDLDGDVTSHYTISPSPANTNNLIPGVPLQLSYTVKLGVKAPAGETKVEVKITGIETESSTPLQAMTYFKWHVEGGKRFFRISTEHNNIENAGNPFCLRIECYLEQNKDTKYTGDKLLEILSNATPLPNGNAPSIPERITVNFVRGEGRTPTKFMLVNTKEHAVIEVRESKLEGRTPPIQLNPGPLASFQTRIATKVRNSQSWKGIANITAIDVVGNAKENFTEDTRIILEGIQGQLVDEGNKKLDYLPGEWFYRGKIDLLEHKIRLICSPNQNLPAQASLLVTSGNVRSSSKEFEVLPRPVKVSLKRVIAPGRAIAGEDCTIKIETLNEGSSKLQVDSAVFSFQQNGKSCDLPFRILAEQTQELARGQIVSCEVALLKENVVRGRLDGEVELKLSSAEEKVSLKGSFSFEIEPAGRILAITTENGNKETAGIPFALNIVAKLDDQIDTSFTGTFELSFSSDATGAKAPRLPKSSKVDFRQGIGMTSHEFILYNAQETPTIKAYETIKGGAEGFTSTISIIAGGLQTFQWKLESQQTNNSPFEGENYLIALDGFENIKTDFQEDIRVHTTSQKGEVCVEGSDLRNIIPGHAFQSGKADLSQIKFYYAVARREYLPIQEEFIATYGEKKGESNTVFIQPRPLSVEIQEVSFSSEVYQGEQAKPLVINLQNSGDIELEVTDVSLEFISDEQDISPSFTVIPHPHNESMMDTGASLTLTYHIDIDGQANIGPVNLYIKIKGEDSSHETQIDAQVDISFDLLEKLREFMIVTEHSNTETVGEPFLIKMTVLKDEEQDLTYEGEHEIFFKSNASSMKGHAPCCPPSEIIQFAKGKGQSQRSFLFTNAQQTPVIIGEEKNKASGSSEEININAGPIHSFKIIFDKENKDELYCLQPLDRYENIVNKTYKLDEDIKTGMILSGSGGSYYEVIEMIGHGAMGKVYKAERLNDGLFVAIKTMLFSALSDINRFLLEGLMLIRFDHPNIVKGYDLRQICTLENNRTQSKHFMVMEYLPGDSVKELIDASPEGMLEIKSAIEIMVHASRGLSYMWEHNTIHRDIKPDNIQVTQDGKIKMIDLGIAHAEGGMLDITLTQKDTVVGSYPYISPERLKSTNVDFRADIYSLGATFYHMVTGMPPYLDSYKGGGGRDLLEYLIRVRTKKMPTPPHKLRDIPSALSKLIMHMLQIKANKRFNTAEELMESLEKIYAETK